MVLNLWCIVVVLLIWVEQILAVHLVLIQESHANLLLLWLLLGEDSLYPCTLWHDEYLVVVSELLLVETTWFLQAVLWKGSGADVETAFNDILDTLRKTVPTTTEVALQHFDELSSGNVTDVLVGEVGNAHDRALLDGKLLVLVVDAEGADLETAVSQLVDHFRAIHLYLLNLECTANDIEVSALVVLQVVVFLCSFPKAENIIFLDIPNTAL